MRSPLFKRPHRAAALKVSVGRHDRAPSSQRVRGVHKALLAACAREQQRSSRAPAGKVEVRARQTGPLPHCRSAALCVHAAEGSTWKGRERARATGPELRAGLPRTRSQRRRPVRAWLSLSFASPCSTIVTVGAGTAGCIARCVAPSAVPPFFTPSPRSLARSRLNQSWPWKSPSRGAAPGTCEASARR